MFQKLLALWHGHGQQREEEFSFLDEKVEEEKVTKDEYLNGAPIPDNDFQKAIRKEWAEYGSSEEAFDEALALMEMDLYDGPQGDA